MLIIAELPWCAATRDILIGAETSRNFSDASGASQDIHCGQIYLWPLEKVTQSRIALVIRWRTKNEERNPW